MGLYIRQHVFTFGDRFTVWDELGNERFYVKGEVFSFGKKLHIYDINENEIAYIEQKLLSFMPCYNIYIGEPVARVKQQFTFFSKEYTVDGPGWYVRGDIFAHDYEFYYEKSVIGGVSREWMTWGDCYVINYINPSDELLMLCSVLAIDASLETNN